MSNKFAISKIWLPLIFVILCFLAPYSAIASTEYVFTVSCPDKRLVVEWGVGDIDPGKEFLRVSTGTKYPGCSVSDYNRNTDSDLPRERFSHEAAVIHGIPLLGPLICGIFGC